MVDWIAAGAMVVCLRGLLWNALRLRLTGSVVQPMSSYDLLTYKAIGSNYLSFVVTSMLVFHIATG